MKDESSERESVRSLLQLLLLLLLLQRCGGHADGDKLGHKRTRGRFFYLKNESKNKNYYY